jgi:hypothetical protein
MNKNSRGRYPKAALVGAPIYHYGHVRSIAAMHAKNQRVGKYWGHDHPLFNGYQIDPAAIRHFTGRHPSIVKDWLANEAEKFFAPDTNYHLSKRELKHRWVMKLEKLFGMELSKKHFTPIKI